MFTILNFFFSSDQMIQFRCGGLSHCVRLRQPNALLMSFRNIFGHIEQVHCVRNSAFPKTKWNIWPINVIRVTSSGPCCCCAKQFYVNAINSKESSGVSLLSFVAAAQAIKPNLLRENKTFAPKLMQQHLVFVVRRKNGRTKINCVVRLLASAGMPSFWDDCFRRRNKRIVCWCKCPIQSSEIILYFLASPTNPYGRRTKDAIRRTFDSFRNSIRQPRNRTRLTKNSLPKKKKT